MTIAERINISIYNYINIFRTEISDLEENIIQLQKSNDDSWEIENYKLGKRKKELSRSIEKQINELYNQSLKDNYYFFDCPLKVYKSIYKKRLEEFISKNIDAEERDFIEIELMILSNPEKNRLVFTGKNNINYHQFINSDTKYKITNNKKKEFLYDKAETLGWKVINNIDSKPMGLDNVALFDEPPIVFQKNKKANKKISDNDKKKLSMNNQYLEIFIDSLNNESIIKETCFSLLYKNSITHYTSYLKQEILENSLSLSSDKKNIYLGYLLERLIKTNAYFVSSTSIDKWMLKYNVNLLEFPDFSNKELMENLSLYYSNQFSTEKEREFILDIQIDFYWYAAMLETNKIIDFVENQSNYSSSRNKKVKQFTSNQIVLLLQETGFFSHPIIENAQKQQQAWLISKITGLNEKNLKTNIEKLDKSPSELGKNHKKDNEKIQDILNNLD